ncbi:putative tRNA (guanine(26)-N(2))-dimethyltransferase 1 [Hibiscus syriacus]|uniref:tRNA (guanine(26)-N(2))-dimethyltransferase n=1 Tax=Hibiscus syriacus TaxID=106335 RepID=A0A6A3B252_HIBSY|nr:putative tRNA (guanine(26)-N(2))-dimethyltransferase 1 [Hibiscus syriacus]
MSTAVLRTFISRQKQEYETILSKRNKSVASTSEEHNKTEGKVQRELKPPRVLEALSASGLRRLRYALEVEGIGQVIALDNDKGAVEACQRNIKFNGSVACSKVESHLADARVYMLTHPKEFDVVYAILFFKLTMFKNILIRGAYAPHDIFLFQVDLDPYGSPSVFLDTAVQSVVDGGLLMCIATDMEVLYGGNGEACYSKYGSYPLRGKYFHEMALRILIACIESYANRYKRYIVPLLSVQMDFYVRVFVCVYSAMKNTPLKLSYVYQCTGCDSFHLQPIGRTVSKNTSVRCLPGLAPVVPQECSDCGKKFNMGGPIWSAPIHDQEWVTAILADELLDVPLFLSLHNLCSTLKCASPSAVIFRSAVINAGYRISGTHVQNHPVKAQSADQPGRVILAKEPALQVAFCGCIMIPPLTPVLSVIANFARAVASLSKAQAKKVARFLPNPERHWGPKLRAGRQITNKHVSLLGEDAVNGCLNHQDGERDAKRQKIENTTEDGAANGIA